MEPPESYRNELRLTRVTRGSAPSPESIVALQERQLRLQRVAAVPTQSFASVMAGRQTGPKASPQRRPALPSTPRGVTHPGAHAAYGVRSTVRVVLKG